ncbi:hypothetical protein Dac01nite_03400 [Demequina activiva]|uniref:Uncharacterized protein n=1 Tax=Demequina activiva TaxID=1582364 RepID=A0A919Q365_9MICO|nr:hypothetical protein Dac01nite_03400 [Demequina activiva]
MPAASGSGKTTRGLTVAAWHCGGQGGDMAPTDRPGKTPGLIAAIRPLSPWLPTIVGQTLVSLGRIVC